MLHKKHIYVIVVPDICCSKNPTTCKCFFFVYSTPRPMSSPNCTVSQWDHRSCIVGYHDHVSTASSQRNCVSHSTLGHENLANRCGRRSSSHRSPLRVSETRHVWGNSLLNSKKIHPNSCSTTRVNFCVLFLYPARGRKLSARLFAQTGHECGDNANCCSGRLSRGNLQGHTPWVCLWVPPVSSRLTAWFKRNTSMIA